MRRTSFLMPGDETRRLHVGRVLGTVRKEPAQIAIVEVGMLDPVVPALPLVVRAQGLAQALQRLDPAARTTSGSAGTCGVERPHFYNHKYAPTIFRPSRVHVEYESHAGHRPAQKGNPHHGEAAGTGEYQYTIDQVLENVIRRANG